MIRLCAFVLLLAPMFLLAQQPWEPEPPLRNKGNPRDNQKTGLSYNGTEWFRLALANQNLEPELSLDNALDNPQSTIIMILGDTSVLHNRHNDLFRFLDSGGSLMVATDSPHRLVRDTWNSLFGVAISDLRIIDQIDCFQDIPSCPYISPATPNNKIENSGSRIFRRVEGRGGASSRRLLTNESAILQFIGNVPRGVTKENLAYFSNSARDLRNRPLIQGQFGIESFASAFHYEDGGRALLLADHSVFINDSMMVSPSPTGEGVSFGTANYDFSEDTADWLAGIGRDRKTKCILIVDGRVQQVFALPPPPIPDILPPPDLLAQALKGMINPLLDSLQKDDFFNRQLSNLINRIDSTTVQVYLLGIISFLLARTLFVKLYSAATRKSNAVIQTTPPSSKENLNRQTMREMLSQSDWLFAARRRVRAWLTRFDVNLNQKKMPPVLIARGSNNAQSIEESLARLWKIAQGQVPEFNLSDWDQFNQELERLAKAAKRGEWTFAVEKA